MANHDVLAGLVGNEARCANNRKRVQESVTWEPSLLYNLENKSTVITIEMPKMSRLYLAKPSLKSTEETQRQARKSHIRCIMGATMLYTVLAFPAAFSGLGLHIAAYMRLIGGDRTVEFNHVAVILALAVGFQTFGCLFSSSAVYLIGEKRTVTLSCLGVSLCLIGSACYMHDYYKFFLYFAVGGGWISGLALPLPTEKVINLDRRSMGYNCGLMNGIIGVFLTLFGPLQNVYINKWEPVYSLKENIEKMMAEKVENYGETNFLMDLSLLHRCRWVMIYKAVFFLLLLVCGLRLAYPKNEVREVTSGCHQESDYETLNVRRKHVCSEGHCQEENKGTWGKWISLWILSYFSWVAMIYVHSSWRYKALGSYGASNHDIIVIDIVSRLLSLVARLIWGWIADRYGWKTCWNIISLFTLISTSVLTQICDTGLVLYTAWISVIYIAHAAIFTLVPVTVHKIFGAKNFIRTFSLINTSRSFAGFTALSAVIGVYSEMRFWVPGLVSLMSLLSLLFVYGMDE